MCVYVSVHVRASPAVRASVCLSTVYVCWCMLMFTCVCMRVRELEDCFYELLVSLSLSLSLSVYVCEYVFLSVCLSVYRIICVCMGARACVCVCVCVCAYVSFDCIVRRPWLKRSDNAITLSG